jgi:hypothetical protein
LAFLHSLRGIRACRSRPLYAREGGG